MTDLTARIEERLKARAGSGMFMWHTDAAKAIRAVLDIHKLDPEFTPPVGVCRSCGGTGEVYGGTGADGHIWTGEKCCCDHPHCLHCGECWENDACAAHRELTGIIAKALGLSDVD